MSRRNPGPHDSLGPDPEWFAFVRVGDVLVSPGGTYRAVRKIRRDDRGRLASVTFAIKRRSWTERCYTIYLRNDLRQGWRHAGARVKLATDLDRRIALSIGAADYPGGPYRRDLGPEDVAGVP